MALDVQIDKCGFATDFSATFCEIYTETESICLLHQIDPTLFLMVNFTSDHWNIHTEFSHLVRKRRSNNVMRTQLSIFWPYSLLVCCRRAAPAVDASSRRGRLPLSALLVHSASPHLANRVKPRWLSCRAVCRYCGTLFSPKYKILENPLQQQRVVGEVQHTEGCECKVSASQCLMGTWWFILYMVLNVGHGSLLKCS